MLIREVLSSLAGAVGNPAYSFKDRSLKEWIGNGIKKEAGQPCRRSLPCHGEADESSARQQRGIESICSTAQRPHGDRLCGTQWGVSSLVVAMKGK